MKSKALKFCKFIFVVSICFMCISGYKKNQPSSYTFQLDFKGATAESVQVFFDSVGHQEWNEETSKIYKVEHPEGWLRVSSEIPSDIKLIRIDFNNKNSENNKAKYYLRNFAFDDKVMKILDNQEVIDNTDYMNHLKMEENIDALIEINTSGNDPFFILDVSQYHDVVKNLRVSSYLYYLILSIAIWAIVRKIKFCFSSISELFKNLKNNKNLIMKLGFNDFKTKYASSYLGIIWGFINPLITILVYWFVFQVAFKSGDMDGAPFILWFLCGIVPWFFFSEALNSATNSFIEYSYLVKKVKFNVDILPFIKIISSLFVHLFFVVVTFAVMALYGYYPNIYNIQVLYYLFCMIMLVFSITVFTSSVVLFFRDLGQIISIIVNVGFWFTPIGWNVNIVPIQLQIFLKMNPMFYIVQGFRDSFVANNYFWERPYQTVYFWFFVILMFFIGITLFKKLRPHFADVL